MSRYCSLLTMLGLMLLLLKTGVSASVGWKHSSTIVDADISDDGSTLATLDFTGHIAKWSLDSGKYLGHIVVPLENCESMEFAPGGSYVSVHSMESGPAATVILDAQTGKKIHSTDLSVNWLGPSHFIAWPMPLLAAKEGTPLSIWECKKDICHLVQKANFEKGRIYCVSPLENNRVIIAYSSPSNPNEHEKDWLAIYDWSEGEILKQASTKVPLNKIEPILAISKSIRRVLVTGNCRVAEVFDLATLNSLAKIAVDQQHPGFQEGCLSPTENLAALGKARVELWDWTTGKLSTIDLLNEKRWASPNLLTPHGGFADAMVRHFLTLSCLQFTHDGKSLVGVTGMGEVIIWNVKDSHPKKTYSVANSI